MDCRVIASEICDTRLTLGNMDDIRKLAFGPTVFCGDCIEELGEQEINRIYDEAMSEQKQAIPRHRAFKSHLEP